MLYRSESWHIPAPILALILSICISCNWIGQMFCSVLHYFVSCSQVSVHRIAASRQKLVHVYSEVGLFLIGGSPPVAEFLPQ